MKLRPYYFTPVTSGLAAYCYSHTLLHPSAAIGVAVFYTGCTLTLLLRSFVTATDDCTEECKARKERTGALW